MSELSDRVAKLMETPLRPGKPPLEGDDLELNQVIDVAEEVGEFLKAYRRARGWARTPGDYLAVEQELADVVIAAYGAAYALGFDLDQAVDERLTAVQERADAQ